MEHDPQGRGMAEDDKVRKWTKRITDPRLEAPICQILADRMMRNDFDAAANYLLSIAKMNPIPDRRQLSGLYSKGGRGKGRGRGRGRGCGRGRGRGSSTGRGRGRGGGRQQDELQARYYPDEEWFGFSPEQQEEVRRLRGERDNERERRQASALTGGQEGQQQSETEATAGTRMSQRRNVSMLAIGLRMNRSRVAAFTRADPTAHITRTELDSHADTCTFGCQNALWVEPDPKGYVELMPFLASLGCIERVPVGTCAVAYDDPVTGETTVLLYHQSLYLGEEMDINLVNPNQMRLQGIEVSDIPRYCAKSVDVETHSIWIPELEYRIPLFARGIMSWFPTRKPTLQELETCKCVDMMQKDVEWEPYANHLTEQEENL